MNLTFPANALRRGQGFQGRPLRSITHDHQPRWHHSRQAGHSADQPRDVLFRAQSRDGADDDGLRAVTRSGSGEAGDIDAVRQQSQASPRQAPGLGGDTPQ